MNTTAMSAKELLEICNKYLEERKEYIYNKREALIAAQIGKRMFWTPWKRFDRESAIEWLKDDRWSEWHWVAIEGGFEADAVEELKALAEQSIDGFVRVDAEGAIVIKRILARNK